MGFPKALCAAAVLSIGLAGAAHAVVPVYPTPGTENATTYTFTATGTKEIIAYFTGFHAHDTVDLGLLINGVDTGLYAFTNKTTPLGASFDFGTVHAGDVLVFFIRDFTRPNTFYSAKSMNSDGFNHVYVTSYAGGDFGIPTLPMTYVGFEDLLGGGDKDYNDETFAFINAPPRVSTHGLVPEPATWAMMLMGFGGMGALLRRRRKMSHA